MEIATGAAGSVHGFVDTAGSFTTIDYGGDPRSETGAQGINDSGQIAGHFIDAAGTLHSLIYNGGSFTRFDVSGAPSTSVSGINDNGQLVGVLTDADGGEQGFLATPVGVP